MATVIYVKNYAPPKISVKEILRYAGSKERSREMDTLLQECIKEAEGKLSYKVCYAQFPVAVLEDGVDLGFTFVRSKSLASNLKNCSRCILFAATVGVGIDRLIAKYTVLSPTKALLFQAIGAERIESLCDSFNREMQEKYKAVKPRFSAGYGDFPIETQKDIFVALECPKKIGVHLNESLLLSPSKSVTAIIGVCEKKDSEEKQGCFCCEKTDCDFRE